MTDSKMCRDCGEVLPATSFHRESKSPDGLRVNCKDCRRHYMAGRYAADRDAILARQRANPRDPEAVDAYQRQYRVDNAEKLRLKNRAWSAANGDYKRKYNAAYYDANRETIAAAGKAWREKNHDAVIAMNREREALKRSVAVEPGITIGALRKRDGSHCAYCGIEMQFGRTKVYNPDKASVDHVIPLAQGGPHSFANVVLACLRCNISKRDRRPDEWSPRIPPTRDNSSSPLDSTSPGAHA